MFALAGHLGMTVKELSERMDSQELGEWSASTRYFVAIPDPWAQTGLTVSASLAPHCAKGKAAKASDFVPIQKPPQHPDEITAMLRQLSRDLGS